MRRRALRAIAITIATLFVAPAVARAACGDRQRPWVEIVGELPKDTRGFVDLLRAELAPRKLDLCADPKDHDAEPIARVELKEHEGNIVVAVEARGAGTSKRLEREVDVASMPKDGRMLAVALAADELIRESLAQLALPPAPPPPVPSTPPPPETPPPAPPPPATESPTSRAPPSPPIPGFIDALIAGEHFDGGQTHLGADARGGLWIAPRLAATLRLGVRSGLSASAPDGDVRSTAFLAGPGLAFALTRVPVDRIERRLGVDLHTRLDLDLVSYAGTARPGAQSSSAMATAVLLGAGADTWLSLGPSFRFVVDLSLCDVIRPARATDAGGAVTGVSGLGVMFALGAGGAF